jgi:hypothetical protein
VAVPTLRALVREARTASGGALVLSAAIPFVFLHPDYQPSLSRGSVGIDLSDLAIAAAFVAALWTIRRHGVGVLTSRLPLWLAFVVFLAWLVASIAWAVHHDADYPLHSRIVSAFKYVEFAMLAPVAAIVLRDAADRIALLFAVAAWSAFLTLIAVLQFLGVVDEFDGRRPIQREPSYIGIHELGVFSGVALTIAFATIVTLRRPLLGWLGGIAGGLGVALAAALDAVGGIVVAAAAAAAVAARLGLLTARRALLLATIVVAVAVASVTLRASTVSAFLEFLGVTPASTQTNQSVQSYSHRTLLGYIGLRIWLDHPVAGAGWQESHEPAAFEKHLAAAHRRFPDEPAAAFPSPAHRWGVQNGVIQTLADLGAVGLLLLSLVVALALRIAVRVARSADVERRHSGSVALGALIVAVAVFAGTGLLPGTSVEAMLWLTVGLCASLA